MLLPPVPLSNYGALAVAAQVAKAVRPFAPLAFDSGGASYYDGPATVVVCEGETAWKAVWARHTNTGALPGARDANTLNPAPPVDFERAYVVALFAGPLRNVVGYRLVGGYTLGASSTARLAPLADGSRVASVAVPTPWAFLVLPRLKGAAVAVQLPDGAGGWRTVAQAKPAP